MSVLHLSADTFQDTLKNTTQPVLVDFWATWCGPCRMLAPVIDRLAASMQEEAVIAKVDIDEENELAASYRVMSIPTLILFKDGVEQERVVGVVPEKQLVDLIKRYA